MDDLSNINNQMIEKNEKIEALEEEINNAKKEITIRDKLIDSMQAKIASAIQLQVANIELKAELNRLKTPS